MKIYQVGGAVRDRLLGICPRDTDYVVVGATPQEMRANGFQEVGRGFPVFLHPETKEEYALARSERKTGVKHTDFEFVFSPDVTLEEDLSRRDFTCNAIAYDSETQTYIDPFEGQKDIQNKILRAVDPEHFVEDPLRVLRLCRFAAQLDFKPTAETFELCKNMVADGMLENLSAERVWQEFVKAMQTPRFHIFIKLMADLKALPFQLDQRVLKALKASENQSMIVKFAVLTREKDVALKVPKRLKDFAKRASLNQASFEKLFALSAEELYALSVGLSIGHVWYVEEFIEFCRAFSEETSKVFEEKAHFLRQVCSVLQNIKAQNLPNFALLSKDETLGKRLRAFQLAQIEQIRQTKKPF